MRYTLELTGTAATIGFCACVPEGPPDADQAADYLADRPGDLFMHRHLLGLVSALPVAEARALAARHPGNAALGAALAEAAQVRPELAPAAPEHPSPAASPLVDLRQQALPRRAEHRAWSALLAANLNEHAPLPAPGSPGAPSVPFSAAEVAAAARGFVSVVEVAPPPPGAHPHPASAAEASRRAERALAAAGVPLSQQMCHQMSLAPVGLVRQWRVETSVRTGALDYTLAGVHSSFGRGLEFEAAQVALLMEICERRSAWADVGPEGALGYARPLPLTRARFSELPPGAALDPASLPIEVPAADLPLCWVPGVRPQAPGNPGVLGGGTSLLVPAQCVFLFANLDEPALFSAPGSTGLGAGGCMARARLTALLEIIERDAECVTPHDPARCFRLESSSRKLRAQLAEYAARGMDVWLEDITSELGVPCYRAFAVGPEGQVTKGAAAGLCGPQAAASALFEVPYPFPWGPPTLPGPPELPVRRAEDLPDLSTGTPGGDLARIEAALLASGRPPVYVDLTRADLGIPVCRALVPGLELLPDFDRHSVLSPRLFARLRG